MAFLSDVLFVLLDLEVAYEVVEFLQHCFCSIIIKKKVFKNIYFYENNDSPNYSYLAC